MSTSNQNVTELADGIEIAVEDLFLRLQVRSANIVRVAVAHDRSFFARGSYAVLPAARSSARWRYAVDEAHVTVSTDAMQVRVNRASGRVEFLDLQGRPILHELQGGRTFDAVTIQGEKTFNVRQQWEADSREALYGLGEQHFGLFDIKGYDLELWQHNGSQVIPLLVSNRGYGVFWDNDSLTRFGNPLPFASIPADRLLDSSNKPGGLTRTSFQNDDFTSPSAQEVDAKLQMLPPPIPSMGQPIVGIEAAREAVVASLANAAPAVRWEGHIEPKTTGDHQFSCYSNGWVRIWIDGKLVADHWRQSWLPWYDLMKVHMVAGRRHSLRIDWQREQGTTLRFMWKEPTTADATSLWSEVGDGIDYYFIYGPEVDQIIAGYRQLTGDAPMMPSWAYGLWQCRQRYETSQQVLDVVQGFRDRGIPFDNIVQDWMYWPSDAWGSHRFDAQRFPHPEEWIRTIHKKHHAHLMVSVWPKFYLNTGNAQEMQKSGFLYTPNIEESVRDWIGGIFTFYDAFNPAARDLYWKQIDRELFSKGVDAWWLDGTEPDLLPSPRSIDSHRSHMMPTAGGTGARVFNAYPLLNCQAVYEGQRASDPNRRVFILTRSAFSGQQRYAGASWSGDISSTWTAMRKQIPAGLGFCISGQPYWTQDIGGFSVPQRFSLPDPRPEDVEEWRELNTRWFQWGTFTPLFRVHGEFPYREMWEFGGESHPAYKTQLAFDHLRYRLLPYIYSLAGEVTHRSGTMMRPLIMDFRADEATHRIDDQFMFGPALLVCPVTTYKARSRSVYLPKCAGWYDFWSGSSYAGGQTIEAPAPYETIPVYVRAGSIVPVGPELQYSGEKAPDPITLYVYPGADGTFALYEDEGLNYNYEKGASAQITFTWNDRRRTLTIGERRGRFDGMLEKRTFHVIVCSRGQQTVEYDGNEIVVSTKEHA